MRFLNTPGNVYKLLACDSGVTVHGFWRPRKVLKCDSPKEQAKLDAEVGRFSKAMEHWGKQVPRVQLAAQDSSGCAARWFEEIRSA